jgi:hypothetical protein
MIEAIYGLDNIINNKCGGVCGMRIDRGNRSTLIIPASPPLYSQ